MKKFWKKVWYVLSFQWWEDWKKDAVDAGVCDYSGQGRDKYGH